MNDSDGVKCKARKERSEGVIITKKASRHSVCGISLSFFVFFALHSVRIIHFGEDYSCSFQAASLVKTNSNAGVLHLLVAAMPRCVLSWLTSAFGSNTARGVRLYAPQQCGTHLHFQIAAGRRPALRHPCSSVVIRG